MGVDYVQGYVISEPLAPERILLGASAADFIQDPRTVQFVRDELPAILERADQPGRERFN
jgi:EAL domain-containing protein (putative c-di-GMP-specific phosphodiesterase class I)